MNSNAKNSKFLEMTYTDIQNVKLVDDPSMPYNSIQKRWSFEFIVQTTERVYRLIAASIDERCLFMHTFQWIIEQNCYQTEIEKGTILKSDMNKSTIESTKPPSLTSKQPKSRNET